MLLSKAGYECNLMTDHAQRRVQRVQSVFKVGV